MRRNYCRSVISLQEPLPHSLWISLDLHGILAIVWTPSYSSVSVCVCWPPKRRVYNITSSSLLHRKCLLCLCCLVKVSQYQLALTDTGSVHIGKGVSHHIRDMHVTIRALLRLRRSCRLLHLRVLSENKFEVLQLAVVFLDMREPCMPSRLLHGMCMLLGIFRLMRETKGAVASNRAW